MLEYLEALNIAFFTAVAVHVPLAHRQNDRVMGGITVFTARPITKLLAQNRVVRIRRIYGETVTRMVLIFTGQSNSWQAKLI